MARSEGVVATDVANNPVSQLESTPFAEVRIAVSTGGRFSVFGDLAI